MLAAKNGVIAEFVTGYLQREIRKEFKVANGTDAGLRDGAFGIAVGRLAKVTGGDTLVPAATLAEAEYIIAQSDDTVRDLPQDYNYAEKYSSLPNLVIKNSNALKTVALYKIVNKDDVKLITLGEPVSIITGTVSSGTFTAGLKSYFVVPTGPASYAIKGIIPYVSDTEAGLTAGNRLTLKIKNANITAQSDLPTGTIVKTYSSDGTVREYDKTAFETDGSLIFLGNVENLDIARVDIKWKDTFVEYYFDITKAQKEANA